MKNGAKIRVRCRMLTVAEMIRILCRHNKTVPRETVSGLRRICEERGEPVPNELLDVR